jgi:hypothetical protein
LAPPQGDGLGGVKAGTGVQIDSVTGVITATGTGGTITGVGTGTGLGGGGTQGAVTVFLRPAGYANPTNIGGVYAGDNVEIDPDGRLSVAADTGVQTITGVNPVEIGGTATNPTVSVIRATTSSFGVTQLTSDYTLPDDDVAANATGLNNVWQIADAALPLAGGTMTGFIGFAPTQPFPNTVQESLFTAKGQLLVGTGSSLPGSRALTIGPGAAGWVLTSDAATQFGVKWAPAGQGTVTEVTGVAPVQVADGTSTPSISIDPASTGTSGIVQLYDGVDSLSTSLAATANSVKTTYDYAATMLPLAGGTMTGNITFAGTQTFPGVLDLAGGTMTGAITFVAGQTFPGVVESVGASDSTINVGGTPQNVLLDVAVSTTTQLGVVSPDGTTITVDGNGVISAVAGTAANLQAVTDSGNTTTNGIQVAGLTSTAPVLLPDGTAGSLALSFAGSTTSGFYYDPTGAGNIQLLKDGNSTVSIGRDAITLFTDVQLPNSYQLNCTGTIGLYQSGGRILFYDFDNSNYVGFMGPNTVTTNTLWVLPSGDGAAGEVLTTNGAGQLGWSSAPAANLQAVTTAGNTTTTTLQANTITTTGAFQVSRAGSAVALISDTGSYVPSLSIAGLSYPTTDGAAGDVLSTDGAGTLTWATPQVNLPQPDYGNFYSDNTQQPQTLITGQPVTLNQTVAANNFQIIDGSKVTTSSAGVYNLQFSIQLVSTNQGGDVEIWLAKNGVAVDESNTVFHTKNANEAEFAALNYVETLASGDYLQLIWATDNLDMTLAATASTMGGPNIPSVILTIVPVGA